MSSIPDQLRELAALHSEGLLTKDEFAAAKAKVLGMGKLSFSDGKDDEKSKPTKKQPERTLPDKAANSASKSSAKPSETRPYGQSTVSRDEISSGGSSPSGVNFFGAFFGAFIVGVGGLFLFSILFDITLGWLVMRIFGRSLPVGSLLGLIFGIRAGRVVFAKLHRGESMPFFPVSAGQPKPGQGAAKERARLLKRIEQGSKPTKSKKQSSVRAAAGNGIPHALQPELNQAPSHHDRPTLPETWTYSRADMISLGKALRWRLVEDYENADFKDVDLSRRFARAVEFFVDAYAENIQKGLTGAAIRREMANRKVALPDFAKLIVWGASPESALRSLESGSSVGSTPSDSDLSVGKPG
jgi:hypothetical protein